MHPGIWKEHFLRFSASASQIAWMALTGTASYHLWYVVMIFQFVLLSPIFIWVIRRLQRSFYTKKAFCVISAVFVVFCLAILKFEPLVPSDTFFGGLFFVYRTRLFFSYLLFYGLGCICGLYYQTFCQVLLKTAPLVWAAWCIGILFGSFQSLQFIKQTGTLSFSCVSFLNPGFALLTAAAILAVFSLALKLRQREPLSGLVSFIDQNTFEAYLAHGHGAQRSLDPSADCLLQTGTLTGLLSSPDDPDGPGLPASGVFSAPACPALPAQITEPAPACGLSGVYAKII